MHAQSVGDDAGHVQQVVDQPVLRPGAAFDHFEPVTKLVRGHVVHPQYVRPAEYRGQRGAQLVGHGREKVVFRATRILRVAARGLFLPDQLFEIVGHRVERPAQGAHFRRAAERDGSVEVAGLQTARRARQTPDGSGDPVRRNQG